MMQSALIALITAFAMDVLVGDLPNHVHPVVAMGSFIRWGTRKGNKGNSANRFWTGTLLILCGGMLFSFPWLAAGMAWQGLPFWAQGIITGILLKPIFAFNGLLKAGKEVQQVLMAGDLSIGRRLVAWHLVSRDTSLLSSQQVASATIESLAENLTDSFLAPLMCFVVGGLPLAWFYRFANTADAMIGYRTSEFEYFGKFAARLDDVLNWLPARLAGILVVFSAGLCRLDVKASWRTMINQHGRTSSPNAGWTMSAAAGALRTRLEKVDTYQLDGGEALPEVEDIQRSIRLVLLHVCLRPFVRWIFQVTRKRNAWN